MAADDTQTFTVALTPEATTECYRHVIIHIDSRVWTYDISNAGSHNYFTSVSQAKGYIDALLKNGYGPFTQCGDLCADVTCPDKCTGYDLYSQKCVEGVCVNDALKEHNSVAYCGYVPPCPNVTVSVTLVSKTDLAVTVDVNTSPGSPGSGASWKPGTIAHRNPSINWGDNTGYEGVPNGHSSPSHTYTAAGTYTIELYGINACEHSDSSSISVSVTPADPCAGKTCPDKCFGSDWCSQKCVGGSCVKDAVIEHNSVSHCGYDPCAGKTCPDKCTGYDLYSQKCVNGTCVNDALKEHNSVAHCGYVPPVPAHGIIMSVVGIPATLKKGASLSLDVSIKNDGGQTSTFDVRLVDVGAGTTVSHSSFSLGKGLTKSNISLTGTMPGHAWNLAVEVWR